MIYFLSDFHGGSDLHAGNNIENFRKYMSECKEDDLIIILGDVGMKFEDNEVNREFTEFFLSVDKNVVMIDGNHENFDYLYTFPQENWNGGTIRRITEHIVMLERGNIFNIQGHTFFAFGGCKSSQKWKDMGLWYPQEEATQEEYERAYENLNKHQNQVDYILTHSYYPTKEGEELDRHSLQGLIDFIDTKVDFRKFYSGHRHKNRELDEKHRIVYDEVTPLG